MLVIIEGMDRCGKTTLVKKLREKYFIAPETIVHHASAPPEVDDTNDWELKHYGAMFETGQWLVNEYFYDVIFDRFHLGAAVYGSKYRKSNPFDIYDVDHKYLHGYEDAVLILLTDYPEAIYSRDDGNSLEKSTREYEETRLSFIEAYNASSCMNKLHINITDNGGFKNTFPSVEKFIDSIKY